MSESIHGQYATLLEITCRGANVLSGFFYDISQIFAQGCYMEGEKRIEPVRRVRKLIRNPHEFFSGFVYEC